MLCPECEKCQVVDSPRVTVSDYSHVQIDFDQVMIWDKTRRVQASQSSIEPDQFLDQLIEHFESTQFLTSQASLGFLGDGDFELHFKSEYEKVKASTPSTDVSIFYIKDPLESVRIVGQRAFIALTGRRGSLLDLLTTGPVDQSAKPQKTEAHFESQTDSHPQPAQNCSGLSLLSVKLAATDFKASIDGIMRNGQQIFLISRPQCAQSGNSLLQKISEVSISILSIATGNLIREYLFSFLNNKEMLDLVKFDSVDEAQEYGRIDSFFATFDCLHYEPYHSASRSFESGKWIRGLFVPEYHRQFAERVFADEPWLAELERQHLAKYPASIRDHVKCRFRLISPEYLLLGTCGLVVMFGLLCFVCNTIAKRRKEDKANDEDRTRKVCSSVYRFFEKQFGQILFFIYFYNLISFLSFLKLVKSAIFGGFDFACLALRCFFVCYPLKFLVDNLSEYKDENLTERLKKQKRVKPNGKSSASNLADCDGSGKNTESLKRKDKRTESQAANQIGSQAGSGVNSGAKMNIEKQSQDSQLEENKIDHTSTDSEKTESKKQSDHGRRSKPNSLTISSIASQKRQSGHSMQDGGSTESDKERTSGLTQSLSKSEKKGDSLQNRHKGQNEANLVVKNQGRSALELTAKDEPQFAWKLHYNSKSKKTRKKVHLGNRSAVTARYPAQVPRNPDLRQKRFAVHNLVLLRPNAHFDIRGDHFFAERVRDFLRSKFFFPRATRVGERGAGSVLVLLLCQLLVLPARLFERNQVHALSGLLLRWTLVVAGRVHVRNCE